ncbi:transposase [Psychroserpens sp. NJDZ02]|uniref:transposase n=1 Tax=Psychroserpens sp. NJDZ02 TaxID=2570561 RepID=UPI0010A80786|nr:transposase [Psychroserpens sp. NJDZ02]QCE43447.1 transposase [Psychroserpens sp. NJDZ02]
MQNQTKSYYGNCGQKSLDPVVFFKFCLVGYLENITSDRKLLLYFIENTAYQN